MDCNTAKWWRSAAAIGRDRLNGSDLRVSIDDAFGLEMSIAHGSVRDLRDIADRLRPWAQNLDGTE